MIKLKPLLLFLLIGIRILPCTAQTAWRFLNIDTRMGLCDNSINSIRQDKSGMLWIATWNGLCRYDGVSFYPFYHSAADPATINNSYVNAIELGCGGLWAATKSGLDYLSFTSGRFTRCTFSEEQQRPRCRQKTYTMPLTQGLKSLVSVGGRLFVAGLSGRVYVNEPNSDPTVFKSLPLKVGINALCQYRGGQLLAVGSQGVYLLSADGRRILGSLKKQITTNDKCNIYYSRNTDLVIIGNGLGSKGIAVRVRGNRLEEVNTALPADILCSTDYNGGIAIATDGHGLAMKQGESLTYSTPTNSTISGDAVYTLFVDKDKNLWVGTYRKGLSLLTHHQPWWTTYSAKTGSLDYDIVTAVVPDGDRLYLGLDGGGVDIIDRTDGKLLKHLSSRNSPLPANNIVSMLKDERHIYMVAYTCGLVRMNPDGSEIKTFHMSSSGDANADNIWTMCDDGLGRIWIGGPDVSVFDKRTERIATIKGLTGIDCSAILCRGGFVWLSSNTGGVYKVDRRTMRIVAHYSTDAKSPVRLPSDDIKYIYMDRHGLLWLTSELSGFYSLDVKRGQLTHYGREKGLTSQLVMSIAEDNSGDLWLGTANGLFRYNHSTGVFVRFDEDTSLPPTYTYSSAVCCDGLVYMGSLGGLVCFDPRTAVSGTAHGGVEFVSLRLINEDNRELPLFGTSPKKITLEHDQNFFTLSFTVPDIYVPGRIQFACRLVGVESGWRELDRRREVSYTNVPPGHYKFLVRSTDGNGRWNAPSTLEITITPPWYATVWAKLLWALIVIGLVVAGAWLYLHELSIKHRMRISQIEKDAQRKLNEAKMNFYTNITHELRTPVFLIAAQLEELLDAHKSVLQVPASYLQAMYRSAHKLNRLINRVIDFRKLDSGVLRLNMESGNVISFCDNLTEDYEELCSQKDISFTFTHQQETVMLTFDKEKLEIILSNLVSNAFKYTNDGGHVALTVSDETDRVVFAVSDDGIGIVSKMQDSIFESFVRTERGEKQSGGDGLGLSFVRQLVELHDGEISVESEVNVGSTFTFFIPKSGTDSGQECHYEEPITALTGDDSPIITNQKRQYATMPVNPAATHTVLVIDDEPETVSLIERTLSADYKVLKAYNGEEGLQMARQRVPDVVICDIMMPRMDGLEFLTAMKNDKTLGHIKTIIFTAKANEEDMLTAYDSGADAYLTKPLSLKVLRKRVDRLVAQTDNTLIANSITAQKRTYNKEEQIFLLRCREVIDDNLANPDFTIETMADSLAMSHSALYKKVKTITGMSLITFINDYKVYKAVQLFRQGMTSIEAVSTQCGFRDVKNFREMFKRKMNMTPKQFVLSI